MALLGVVRICCRGLRLDFKLVMPLALCVNSGLLLLVDCRAVAYQRVIVILFLLKLDRRLFVTVVNVDCKYICAVLLSYSCQIVTGKGPAL